MFSNVFILHIIFLLTTSRNYFKYIFCTLSWVMIYEKGYQEIDYPVSAVTTKVKGLGYTNITDNPAYEVMTWDTADYVVPPQVLLI